MAPLPKNSIDNHFTHPGHTLTALENDREYLCDGCKTLGSGKRFRCHGCNFDLHEYCGTCPLTLSSFMHKHALSLVMRKAQAERKVDRICDVCKDPVDGLFYRCGECEFDVHPLCTQLPKQLNHALHKIHPLSLESSSRAGLCAVCNGDCNRWRYRCGVCKFDIHLECMLVPIVPCPKPAKTPYPQTAQTNQREIPMFDQRIPYQPPPQFADGHAFPYYSSYGYGYPFRPGYNIHYAQHNMHPNSFMPQNQVGVGSSSNGKRPGKSMFALVGQLGIGVLSNMIFGVDLTSFF